MDGSASATAPPPTGGTPPGGPPASGQGGQPGVDVPEEGAGRKRGPHPDAGQYVVLAADPPEGVTIELTDDGEPKDYRQLAALRPTMVWAGPAEDGKEAKQKALANDTDLKGKVDPGGSGAWLVAVPLMNIKWRFARAEQPPPIVKGL